MTSSSTCFMPIVDGFRATRWRSGQSWCRFACVGSSVRFHSIEPEKTVLHEIDEIGGIPGFHVRRGELDGTALAAVILLARDGVGFDHGLSTTLRRSTRSCGYLYGRIDNSH